MEPKFQSSFIPKGSITPTPNAGTLGRPHPRERSLFSFISGIIFSISVILAMGTFGYKLYLDYSIDHMSQELDTEWNGLQPEVIRELVDLDARIISTDKLISAHQVITPVFEFLEESTPVTVRYNSFEFTNTLEGIEINMRGEARGYTALALQSDIFNQSQFFRNAIFSNFTLNETGNVTFSFKALINPNLVSYTRKVENSNITPLPTTTTSTTSTTATSTPN